MSSWDRPATSDPPPAQPWKLNRSSGDRALVITTSGVSQRRGLCCRWPRRSVRGRRRSRCDETI
ncbi:hypothetical protein E2C01_072232 [Portunus trituberculatus]|uniref:Uncharacterized protein n=1 Tax=Portunus trituberculatus TaxID=210409 RepID=A0A5B7I768_PORTR|nr:hypothetical protein [Portunus trituberculatus]